MPNVRVTASALVPAPAPVVYDLIADYRVGHPSILPPKYFEKLIVESGGRGAGTRIRFTVIAFGQRNEQVATITEPIPGRELVETDVVTGSQTTFIVEPAADGRTKVTFDTEYRTARGLKGWVEGLMVPGFLKKVYAAELEILSARAVEKAAK